MDKQQREYIHHLMLQYSDAMVRLTYRRVGDWHLAEDLVQETFLTACCKSERVCGHKKPVAWLFETLNNLTLRESRRFYHTEVSIEDIAESYELTELPMACHIPMGLVIRALKIISPDITVAEERDTDAISYQHNQEEFFIVSDRQWMKADWENEGIFFSISGQISEDEIKEMIDSIQ